MKLSFKIDYQTTWGQVLYVAGSSKEFGEWNPSKALIMTNNDHSEWQLECKIPLGKRLEYKYLLKDENGIVIWESGKNRLLDTTGKDYEEVRCRDFWRVSRNTDVSLSSSAFTKVLMLRQPKSEESNNQHAFSKILRIQILEPRINPD